MSKKYILFKFEKRTNHGCDMLYSRVVIKIIEIIYYCLFLIRVKASCLLNGAFNSFSTILINVSEVLSNLSGEIFPESFASKKHFHFQFSSDTSLHRNDQLPITLCVVLRMIRVCSRFREQANQGTTLEIISP